MRKTGNCRECGTKFERKQHNALFCSTKCRNVFNRRRRDRGAELYDVIMSHYREPDRGASWADVRARIEAYTADDALGREGRPSWQPWWLARLRLPLVVLPVEDGR